MIQNRIQNFILFIEIGFELFFHLIFQNISFVDVSGVHDNQVNETADGEEREEVLGSSQAGLAIALLQHFVVHAENASFEFHFFSFMFVIL